MQHITKLLIEWHRWVTKHLIEVVNIDCRNEDSCHDLSSAKLWTLSGRRCDRCESFIHGQGFFFVFSVPQIGFGFNEKRIFWNPHTSFFQVRLRSTKFFYSKWILIFKRYNWTQIERDNKDRAHKSWVLKHWNYRLK